MNGSLTRGNGNGRARPEPKVPMIRRLLPVIGLLTLLSMLGGLISLIFRLSMLATLAMTGIGVVLVTLGFVFFFQTRKSFTAHDNFMTNLVGGGYLLLGVAVLVWTWLQ